MELFNELTTHALEAITQGSPGALAALFFVAALTEMGIPFPFVLDSALFFTSSQTGPVSTELLLILAALLVGREVGAAVIYWISYFFCDAVVRRLQRRHPSVGARLNALCGKLSQNAPVAVAIARLTPGLLTVSTVASAAIKMRFCYFALGIVLASVVADGALIILGVVTKYGLSYLGLAVSPWLIIVIGFFMVAALTWAVRQLFFKGNSAKKKTA